jgi:undecaprenyl phosphate N,N'-diacetylbacillosamine 1-phosphate transferase
MKSYKFYKRILDFFGVFILAPFFLPAFVIVALLQMFLVNGSIFFMQERLGKQGKPFIIYKFKTLEAQRNISKWSVFLRMSHLDEIPQILNIIVGDMSFIGPRPLLKSYYPYFTASELERFKVQPGLTGLAQVKGGNELSWNKRLALDAKYALMYNLLTDFYILMKTFKVISRLEKAESISLIEERGSINKS